MNITFHDLQDLDDSVNGAKVQTPVALSSLFRSMHGRQPFMFELRGQNGFMLTIGWAGDSGSVQFGHIDGSSPYMMAVGAEAEDSGFIEFLVGNTPTPVPKRYCLPIKRVCEIAEYFLLHGNRSNDVQWEEI